MINRLNLRDKIENKCLESHKEFLAQFQQIDKVGKLYKVAHPQSLEVVEDDVNKLQELFDTMQARLHRTTTHSGDLIKRAEVIFQSKYAQNFQSAYVQQIERSTIGRHWQLYFKVSTL